MKNKLKERKGITLIALVITIIVLLILAGISIATLTGENGLLTKANTAKEQTEIADTIERARVDILGAQAENKSGNITKKQFVEILNDYFNNVPTAEELPEDLTTLTLTSKTEYGSHDIKVSDIWNGTFAGEIPVSPDFDENEFTLGTDASDAQNKDKYGWRVPKYTVQASEMSTNVWRLFYQDSNYTYLITDEYVGSYKPSDYYTTMKNGDELKYQTGADVSTVGQKLSSKISTLFTSSNKNTNIRTTAWLTDISDTGMWSSYKNTDAVFAIGSPTAELFAASYNNRSNKTTNIIELDLGTYGYTQNTSNGWLSVSDNHGIYNKSTSSYWWLASPYSDYSGNELRVNGINGYLSSGNVDNNSRAVRPIVCIPTSVFNNKYTLENK